VDVQAAALVKQDGAADPTALHGQLAAGSHPDERRTRPADLGTPGAQVLPHVLAVELLAGELYVNLQMARWERVYIT
jgi:hypothetical protein